MLGEKEKNTNQPYSNLLVYISVTVALGRKIKVRWHMRGRTPAGAGGKLASTQIIACVHTCVVAERRRSRSKNRSTRNGSNTQFTAPASKPRAPNHHCPQEMADPPASAPCMCEHTRGSGAGISKSARLRSATALRMCECSLRYRWMNDEQSNSEQGNSAGL